jgi:predicted glycosyltransferase involved in capsule biosynthesis
MTSKYNFTYIISYRHSIERLNNLKRVLEWINAFSGAEVIVVEQDKHSKIKDIKLSCRHIFLKSNMPFNKSWGFNVGLKYANSNVIIFGDSDLIMDPQEFINSVRLLEQYEMVNPYNSVIDLNQQESGAGLENIMRINRPGRGETDIQKVPLCGGICIFRKDAIHKIGGWHENFVGWGGEDDFQSIKVKNFLSWHENSTKCYHLYHDRPAPDMKWYQRNLQLLQKLSPMSKEELQKVINTEVPKSGLKYKYDNF